MGREWQTRSDGDYGRVWERRAGFLPRPPRGLFWDAHEGNSAASTLSSSLTAVIVNFVEGEGSLFLKEDRPLCTHPSSKPSTE